MTAHIDNEYYTLANSQLFPIKGTSAIKLDQSTSLVLSSAAEAYRYYEAGDWKEALESYTMAIQQLPNQPFFYACRSLLNKQLGDDEGAFYDYQVAKGLDFNYHHFLEWKENEGAMVEAPELSELREKLKHSQTDPQLFVNRAMLHVQHFCYQEAVDDFASAYTLRPEAEYLISAAAVYMRMLRYDRALELLNKVIDDNGEQLLDAFLYRGKLYASINERILAEQDFNFCLAHDNGTKEYVEERAGFFEKNGEHHKAIADYTRLLELDPEDFFPYVMRADLYEKTSQLSLAVADYDRAIALNPYYSDLYHYRATLKSKSGDTVGAAVDMKKFEELENED